MCIIVFAFVTVDAHQDLQLSSLPDYHWPYLQPALFFDNDVLHDGGCGNNEGQQNQQW